MQDERGPFTGANRNPASEPGEGIDKAGKEAERFVIMVTLAGVSKCRLQNVQGHTEAKIWGLFVWEPRIWGEPARIITLAGTVG